MRALVCLFIHLEKHIPIWENYSQVLSVEVIKGSNCISRVEVGMRNLSLQKTREVLTCKREESKCFCYDLCFVLFFLFETCILQCSSTVFCKAELQANIAVQSSPQQSAYCRTPSQFT